MRILVSNRRGKRIRGPLGLMQIQIQGSGVIFSGEDEAIGGAK
jgi:hypothetical protein